MIIPMKRFLTVISILFITFTIAAQTLESTCRAIEKKNITNDFFTKCYAYFNAPEKKIKITYPHTLTLYLRDIETLSSGRLHLSAKDSQGNNYMLYFVDFTDWTGCIQLHLEREKPNEEEAYRYYYNFDPNQLIPILNKIINVLE